MLINFSNHPSEFWSEKQKNFAKMQFGSIIDLKFPSVPALADESNIADLAKKYGKIIKKIFREIDKEKSIKENGIHLMGELTFCNALIDYLRNEKYCFYASTSERVVLEENNGIKVSEFSFVNFRKYTKSQCRATCICTNRLITRLIKKLKRKDLKLCSGL